MKVLFIHNSMSFGGAEKQVLYIIIGLIDSSIDVSLVTFIRPLNKS
jgi:hypothetical protein